MKTIKLMVFCLIIASIQSSIIGDENMPFYSFQDTQAGTFTEDTSIITVLDYGATLAVGPPKEVVKNPEVIRAYLGGVGDVV